MTRCLLLAWPPLLATVLLPGCTDPAGSPDGTGAAADAWFTDVTEASGLHFTTTSGRAPATQILEVKGGGLALIDHDGDGDLDVFVPNGATLDAPTRGPGCRLYANDGALRFRDVTAEAGLVFRGWGMGVAVGDIDADGHDDLYVSCFGPNALLRNRGDGTFEDVSARAGVDHAGWSTGCAFGDVDGDGDLDLYVTNYLAFDVARPPPGDTFKGVPVFGGPMGLAPQADVLYENRGDGTFADVTEAWGCAEVEAAYGLGVTILDIDADGAQEILVGNDSMPNFLFDDAAPDDSAGDGAAQGGPRPLADRAPLSGIACNGEGANQATMGIAVGDVDNNGLPDVFTTNFAGDSNTLHLNVDGRFFDDRTSLYGLRAGSQPFVGWATAFCDFDHDGDEDLLVFNGHTYPHASMRSMDSEARQPALLYEREGARFLPVPLERAGAWLGESHVDRSAAFGDLDGDGDVDVVVTELNGPLRILRNDAADTGGTGGGAWLVVHLHDARPGTGNPRGLGSRVEVRAEDAAWTRWIASGGSYLAASAAAAHVGLGRNEGPVDVHVTWPDGRVQVVSDVSSRQHLVVRRDD
ncbi:MAG: CRTAC1 family protein [Planctomycetota bacterium]|jgi:hypothetical protein